MTEDSGGDPLPSRRAVEAERFGTVTAGVLLALLLFVAFWPIISRQRSFFHLDLRYEHLPVLAFTQRVLISGGSPFWIDGEYCGHRSLFLQEAPLFYPLTVPLLRTGAPVERLADLFSLFHFWLAGFTAYLLVRDLGASAYAALFAGVAWMLSARMVQSAIWPNAVAAGALLPILLLGIFRIGRGQRRSGVFWSSVSGALLLLSGRPQVILGAGPLLIAAAIAAGISRRSAWLDLGMAALLAAALGGPSLLTSAALYPETSRAGGLARQDRDVLPIWFGQNMDQVFLPVDGPPRWPEAAAYPGALVALAFGAGLFRIARRDPQFPRRIFLALALGGVLGLLFAFGERGPYALFARLPIVSGFRVPARFLISWSLCLALASSLAVSRWLDAARRPLAGVAAVAILALDLGWHAHRAAPTAPFGLTSQELPIVSMLRPLLGADESGAPRRFWSLARPPMWVDFSTPESIEASRRLDTLGGAAGMRFGLESVQGGGPTLERTEQIFARPSQKAALLGGVGAVVLPAAPGDTSPFRIQRVAGLPRLLLVPEAVVVPEAAAVRAVLDPRLDPRRTVILEEGEPLRSAAEPAVRAARLLSSRPGFLRIEAECGESVVLVIFNSYERGWQATIDGISAPVLRADGAFQGIRLGPGKHTILLKYSVPLLREGWQTAIAGVLGLALVMRRLPSDPRQT